MVKGSVSPNNAQELQSKVQLNRNSTRKRKLKRSRSNVLVSDTLLNLKPIPNRN